MTLHPLVLKRHLLFFLTFILSHCHLCLCAHEGDPNKQAVIQSFLLPPTHPLFPLLKNIFNDSKMFRSEKSFRRAGFKVKSGHKGLMVGEHSSVPSFLFKKFLNQYAEKDQLDNFLNRLQGARKIQNYIKEHHLKHIVVPQKWLYKLPHAFSKMKEAAYILIVEKMDIYDDWKNPNGKARQLYYHMDKAVLTELCTLLHDLEGCDSIPRNQPFTYSGQIAFIDTEGVGTNKEHFFKFVIPALNPELQAYAIALWETLEENKKSK